MGQVSWHEVTLERLVTMSQVIVVARRAEPAFEQVSIAIDEVGTDGQPCPPFTYRRARYVVERVLRGEVGEGILEVDPADCDWRHEMHRDYYVIGLSTSPIHPRFEGPPVDGDGPRLVFAQLEKGRWVFSVAGAEAAVDRLDDVLAQLPAVPGQVSVGLLVLVGVGLAFLALACLGGLWAWQ